MIRTNDVEPGTPLTVAKFYDALAPDYDTMTGFQKRFVHEKPFFRLLVEKYKIRTVLDAGCGTGFHSLLLAQLGVQVTAIDVSPVIKNPLRSQFLEYVPPRVLASTSIS
jgi:ubiquinone/menaquinone biosynthesis C-methylase UbiE